MKAPEPGQTVDVWRFGELWLKLHVRDVEPDPVHEGWVTLHGNVRREGGVFGTGYWESRRVSVKLQEDGSVRMLNQGERLHDPRYPADKDLPVPGQ